MKKKFIRVMFFGALALATGASFVGCKDYDDDIDAVNARVDGIEKTLSELQAQVGGYVKSVVYDPVTGKLLRHKQQVRRHQVLVVQKTSETIQQH